MKKKPPPVPFWRNPRHLAVTIGLASATLVSAGAAAVMLNSSGDFSTVPHVKRLAPTQKTASLAPPPPSQTEAAPTSAIASEEPTPELPVPQPSAVAPSQSAAPRPSLKPTPPASRTELTRNPMSFHPSPVPKP